MKHSIKSLFVATFFLAIFICGIAAIFLFLDWDTYASSSCQLSLPSSQVSMIVDVNEYQACEVLPTLNGYLYATLSNVPSGYSVADGTYPTFCADLAGYILDNPMFGNVIYQVQLLSSINNPTFAGRPWDKVNYILTHYPIPQNSWLDVQAAIWTLIYGCTPQSDPTLFDCQPYRTAPYYFPFGGTSSPYGCPPNGIVNKTNFQQIVADANANGNGFTPGNGNLFAIIINPQSCSGNSGSYCADPNHLPFQLLFTTTTCIASYTISASASTGGSISPSGAVIVNHGADESFTITPDTDYHVSDVLADGSSVGAVTSYTFNYVTADHTIRASFALNALSDLSVSSLTASVAGSTISIGDTTRNGGSGAAGASTTSFYLSTDSTLDAGDTLLGSRLVPALAAGASSAGTTSVLIPAGTTPGTYYIIAKADAPDAIAETNEANNTTYTTIIIGIDLSGSSFTAPATAIPGTTISIGDATANSGASVAGASTTSFYLSTNSTLDAGDTVLGSRPVPALAAGASSTGTISVTIPLGTAPGTYYIIAKADAPASLQRTMRQTIQLIKPLS